MTGDEADTAPLPSGGGPGASCESAWPAGGWPDPRGAEANGPLVDRQVMVLAEELADAVRESKNLRAPINVQRWCRRAGVELERVGRLEEGQYLRDGPRPTVQVSPGVSDSRRNFTLAHELGHHFIEEARRQPTLRRLLNSAALRWLSRVAIGGPDEERICDAFARALLVPPRAVTRFGCADPVSLQDLQAFADEYSVPVSTAAVRVAQLANPALLYISCTAAGEIWLIKYRADNQGLSSEPARIRLPTAAPRRGVTPAIWQGRRTESEWVTLDIERRNDRTLIATVLSRGSSSAPGHRPPAPAPSPAPRTAQASRLGSPPRRGSRSLLPGRNRGAGPGSAGR
jgi:IrrE N-terminal-like domain